jgi:hypothetical protein
MMVILSISMNSMQKVHNPNYNVHDIKIRMIVVSSSGSGKTNVVVNLTNMLNGTFNHIYIYTRCKAEPLYQFLESNN